MREGGVVAVDDALRGIIRVPILQGRLVESVDLTSTFQDVAHGLGRPAVGYIVVGSTDGASIKRDKASERNPSQTIRLATDTGSDTVDLWVF